MRPRYTPYIVPALLIALLSINYLYLVSLSEKNPSQNEVYKEVVITRSELEEEYAATLGILPQKPIHFKASGPARSERILSFLLSNRTKDKFDFKKVAASRKTSEFLATLKQEELLYIASLALDTSFDQDSRKMSLYLLTSSLPQSTLGLVEIASMPFPESASSEEDRKFELSLRMGALLALDSLPREPKMKEAFQRVFTQAEHPVIRDLALMALSGWEKNQPRSLEQFAKRISWKTLKEEGRL